MKRILFAAVLCVIIVLAGCTMEKERNEILNKVEDMGSKLSELTALANEKNFDQFKENVESADIILDGLIAMVDEAEQKGEKPEFISRARADTAYLKGLFQALTGTVELVQKMEDIKPLMEQLQARDVSKLDTAILKLGEIIENIEAVKQSIYQLLGLSGALSKEDAEMLNMNNAMAKMMDFERQVSSRTLEFTNLKTQLESLREKIS